jgi:uncharacterized protein (TIGR00266 family)
MEILEKGKTSFTHLAVKLEPGEEIITESGAMASQDVGIDLKASLKGGFFSALVRKIFGGESLFINTFTNIAKVPQTMVISKETPGDVFCHELKGDRLFLQPGAFLCCTPGVQLKTRWAGFKFLLAGEGLFRLMVTGTGKVWVGVFGTMLEKEMNGELIVDSGHLVAYPPEIDYKLQLSGGLISSFTSGEGLVGRLEGRGKILLQTRSLGGLVGWLNPRLPG